MMKQIPKPGQRLELVSMPYDPNPIEPGSRGTVIAVQDVMGQTHIEVAWDSGRTLSLVAAVDSWTVTTRG